MTMTKPTNLLDLAHRMTGQHLTVGALVRVERKIPGARPRFGTLTGALRHDRRDGVLLSVEDVEGATYIARAQDTFLALATDAGVPARYVLDEASDLEEIDRAILNGADIEDVADDVAADLDVSFERAAELLREYLTTEARVAETLSRTCDREADDLDLRARETRREARRFDTRARRFADTAADF
jgi:hypothetical protein